MLQCWTMMTISLALMAKASVTSAFAPRSLTSKRSLSLTSSTRRKTPRHASGRGFGAPSSKKESGGASAAKMKKKSLFRNKTDRQRMEQELLEKYGEDIAQGTADRIQQTLDVLEPPALREAARLYKEINMWDAHFAGVAPLPEATVAKMSNPDEGEKSRERLLQLYEELDMTDRDLHNLFQRITWDASADAKAYRSAVASLSDTIESRIQTACGWVRKSSSTEKCRALDVGCGYGTLLPYLLEAGVTNVVGIDLSKEMIKNAKRKFGTEPEVAWEVGDYYQYSPTERFDCVVFSSTFHDMPDPIGALRHAFDQLLVPGGEASVVLCHAQGASHVSQQVRANPIMVRSPLPTAEQLRGVAEDLGFVLVKAPSAGGTGKEDPGYLGVLRRKPEEKTT